MNAMSNGINLDTEILNQVLLNKLAQATIREAQLEAAVQGLLQEKQNLEASLEALKAAAEEVVEVEA